MSSSGQSLSVSSNEGGSARRAAHRDAWLWLAVAVALFALLRLGVLGHGLRVASFDDDLARNGWVDARAAAANLDLDYSIGRFYAPWKFAALGWLQAGASPLAQVIARSGALLAAAAGLAWFCAHWTGQRRDAIVGATLFLAAYPFYEGYQAYFSNPLLLVGLGAVCASAALLSHSGMVARALSLGLLALALVCQEMFVLFAFLHLALALRREGSVGPGLIRRLAPEATIIVAYIALNFTLRAVSEGSYDGARLSLRPIAALDSLVRYTLASLPGVELWLDRASTGSVPLRAPSAAFGILAARIDAATLLLAAGAAALVYWRLSSAPATRSLGVALTCGFLFLLVALPNVLPAMTEKYQIWALQRRLPYYYGVLGLGFGFCGLFSLRHLLARPLPWLSAAAAAGVAALVLATQAMNAEVVDRLSRQPVDASPLSSP